MSDLAGDDYRGGQRESGRGKPMDEDYQHYAIPTIGMPPENRISCALESMVVLRKLLGLACGLLHTSQLNFTAEQMAKAPPVFVARSKAGAVAVEVQS